MKPGFDKALFLSEAIEVPAEFTTKKKRCLVLAPHPDDESLGCGGLIAGLKDHGSDVRVLFTTDGSMSHPNSLRYPEAVRIELREKEALSALSILDVEKNDVHFMGGKDASLPFPGTDGFEENVGLLVNHLKDFQPDVILVPYELDPHCDHRATWLTLRSAVRRIDFTPEILEYPIWLYELAEAGDVPDLKPGELVYLSLNYEILQRKIKAIQAHTSQVSRLIDDDPTGFILLPDVIAHFCTGREYYLQRKL